MMLDSARTQSKACSSCLYTIIIWRLEVSHQVACQAAMVTILLSMCTPVLTIPSSINVCGVSRVKMAEVQKRRAFEEMVLERSLASSDNNSEDRKEVKSDEESKDGR